MPIKNYNELINFEFEDNQDSSTGYVSTVNNKTGAFDYSSLNAGKTAFQKAYDKWFTWVCNALSEVFDYIEEDVLFFDFDNCVETISFNNKTYSLNTPEFGFWNPLVVGVHKFDSENGKRYIYLLFGSDADRNKLMSAKKNPQTDFSSLYGGYNPKVKRVEIHDLKSITPDITIIGGDVVKAAWITIEQRSGASV